MPGPDGPEPNRLSLLSRWKILDNLRRSLVEPAWLLFFLGAGWCCPGDPLRWTLLAVGAMAAPHIVALLLVVFRLPPGQVARAWYTPVGDAATSMQQLALAIAFCHQAWISVDAIVRTLWRLLVSAEAARVAHRLPDRAHGLRRRPHHLAHDVARRRARRRPARRGGGWLLIRGGALALLDRRARCR